jgi:hypothetical protein
VGSGVRTGRVHEVDRIARDQSPAGSDGEGEPSDPDVGEGEQRGVSAPQRKISFGVQRLGAQYPYLRGNLAFELGVDDRMRGSVGRDDGHAPAVQRQVAREFQRAQYAAAARLGRIVERDEEGVAQCSGFGGRCLRLSPPAVECRSRLYGSGATLPRRYPGGIARCMPGRMPGLPSSPEGAGEPRY